MDECNVTDAREKLISTLTSGDRGGEGSGNSEPSELVFNGCPGRQCVGK